MKPDQTKLVGAALATILVWIYQSVAESAGLPQMPAEVATAVGVILIAILDRFVSDPARNTPTVVVDQPTVNLPPGTPAPDIVTKPSPNPGATS